MRPTRDQLPVKRYVEPAEFDELGAYGWEIGFTPEIASASEGELGGYKEVIVSFKGDGAFSKFKFESGVHRVRCV